MYMTIHWQKLPFSIKLMTHYQCGQNIYWNVHIQSDSSEKPFHCPICEYQCKQKWNLKTHLLTDSKVKPFHYSQWEDRILSWKFWMLIAFSDIFGQGLFKWFGPIEDLFRINTYPHIAYSTFKTIEIKEQ